MMESFDLRASRPKDIQRGIETTEIASRGPSIRSPPTDDAQAHSDGDDAESEAVPNGASKRRRLGTTDFTRRKRAVTACQFCRLRKTRCDNVRPRCGYCIRHKAKCVYGDEIDEPFDDTVAGGGQASGHQQIMERLDELKEMLQQGRSSAAAISSPHGTLLGTTSLQVPSPHAASPQTFIHSPWTSNSDIGSAKTAAQTPFSHVVESHRPSFAALRCESLLRWPSLRSVVPDDVAHIVSFPLECALEGEGNPKTNGFAPRSMPDDRFVHYCKRFLAIVHPRNPILDGTELIRQARAVEENGLQWNSASCLVLLACALGSYTLPWVKPTPMIESINTAYNPMVFEREDRATAEAYYAAALKRVGPLGHSVRDIQCLFLASVFEKFSLRPLQAWSYIQQASSHLQTMFLARGERPGAPFRGPKSGDRHIEQRLFWSCSRAESEFILEMDLRPSGLDDFSYPDAFPSPPDNLQFSDHDIGSYLSPAASDDTQSRVDERGWCYYVSEISLRRTIDETVALLYRKGEDYWMQNLPQLVDQYWGSERQIASWHYHIPAIVQFDEDKIPDEEYACYLWYRSLEWREYTLRPILYYVLHGGHNKQTTNEERELAQKALDIYTKSIPHKLYAIRHGGSWFSARKTFTCASLVLAVINSPGSGLRAPGQWSALVESAMQILEYWGQTAADIRLMAATLAHMYEKTCQRVNRS